MPLQPHLFALRVRGADQTWVAAGDAPEYVEDTALQSLGSRRT